MKPGVAFLGLVAVAVLLAPAAGAQAPAPEAAASLTMAIAATDAVYDPFGPALRLRIDLTVTCAVTHVDQPNYRVALAVKDKHPALTVAFDGSPVPVAFEAADCLGTNATKTRTAAANVTLTLAPTTEAFLRAEATVNATLFRAAGGALNATEALDAAEARVGATMGYVAGLAAEFESAERVLQANQALFNATVRNLANGATRVTAAVTNASASLVVREPEPFVLARGEAREVTFHVSSPTGCPERTRAFSYTVSGASPDGRGVARADTQGGLTVSCLPKKSGAPGPELGLLAAAGAVGAALAHARRP